MDEQPRMHVQVQTTAAKLAMLSCANHVTIAFLVKSEIVLAYKKAYHLAQRTPLWCALCIGNLHEQTGYNIIAVYVV